MDELVQQLKKGIDQVCKEEVQAYARGDKKETSILLILKKRKQLQKELSDALKELD
jgi:hypothetical protein